MAQIKLMFPNLAPSPHLLLSLAPLDCEQKPHLSSSKSSGPSTEYDIEVSSSQTLVKLILANSPQCLCCHPPKKVYMLSKFENFTVLLMYLLNKYNFSVIYKLVSIVNTQ